jgi:hypothetical protein
MDLGAFFMEENFEYRLKWAVNMRTNWICYRLPSLTPRKIND